MRPITVARQLSEGGVPSIDDNRECESAHDVSNLVDAPSAGNASIEAFFTRKGDTVYAILRRWLGMSFARRNAAGLSPSTVSPFGTSGAFRFTGSGTTITVAPPGADSGAAGDGSAGAGTGTGAPPETGPLGTPSLSVRS